MGKSKMLGISFLALVLIMAISATAAEAKWLLLVNGKSVSSIQVVGSGKGGELLVANGIAINCAGGIEGAAKVSLSESGGAVSGSGTVSLTGCFELNFGEACDVHSPGQPAGTIVASGSAVGTMIGEEVSALTTGNPFTVVEFTGEECPLTEINGQISGSIKGTVLNPLEDLKLHQIQFVNEGLLFGGEETEVHTFDENGEPVKLLLASVKEVTGGTFSIHLVGL